MPSLTLAIPTYDRPSELMRLLGIVQNELNRLPDWARVDVIVRDNSNDDVTQQRVQTSEFAQSPWLDYRKNEKNLGFDPNILNLFCEAKGDYVWFIGDDDIIYEGSILKVLELLNENPDIIHLPFRQPQDLQEPQYQKSPRILYHTDRKEAVELILKYIKITSFVLRRKGVEVNQPELEKAYGWSGWMHLVLGFEVIMNSPKLKSMTLSEFFAGSLDKEWKMLNWTPDASLLAWKLLHHELIRKFGLQKQVRNFESGMYLGGIQMTLQVTSGRMSTLLPMKKYLDFGAAYPFQGYLLWKPVWFLKYLIIKWRAGGRIPRLIRLYERMKN